MKLFPCPYREGIPLLDFRLRRVGSAERRARVRVLSAMEEGKTRENHSCKIVFGRVARVKKNGVFLIANHRMIFSLRTKADAPLFKSLAFIYLLADPPHDSPTLAGP